MNKIDLCKTIQTNVSKLTDNENLELFKIILEANANYTKNNNGVFLNLNWIDEDLLIKINNYIIFCIKSQNEISKYELMKTLLNDSINTKEINNDIENNLSIDNDTTEIKTIVALNDGHVNICNQKQKFSSSMKFYLLKKKYLKQNITYKNNINIDNNNLTSEDYLIS